MDDSIPPSERNKHDLPPSENPNLERRLSRSVSVRSNVRTSLIFSAPDLNSPNISENWISSAKDNSRTTGSRSDEYIPQHNSVNAGLSLNERTNNDRKPLELSEEHSDLPPSERQLGRRGSVRTSVRTSVISELNMNDNQPGDKTTSQIEEAIKDSQNRKELKKQAAEASADAMKVENAMKGDHATESQEDRKVDQAIIEGKGKLVFAVCLLIAICWICWMCSAIFLEDH